MKKNAPIWFWILFIIIAAAALTVQVQYLAPPNPLELRPSPRCITNRLMAVTSDPPAGMPGGGTYYDFPYPCNIGETCIAVMLNLDFATNGFTNWAGNHVSQIVTVCGAESSSCTGELCTQRFVVMGVAEPAVCNGFTSPPIECQTGYHCVPECQGGEPGCPTDSPGVCVPAAVTPVTYNTIGQPISTTGVLGIGNNGWFSVIENTENSYLLDFTHSLPCVTENGVIVCPSGLWNSPQQSDLGKTIYVSGTFNMVAGCAAPPGPCVGGPAIIVQSWYFIAPACPPYQCPVGQVQDPVSCQCKSQTTSTTTTMMTKAVQTTSAVLTLTTLSNGAICWVDANHPDQPLCTGALGPSSNPIVKAWNAFWNWLRCLLPSLGGPCLPESTSTTVTLLTGTLQSGGFDGCLLLNTDDDRVYGLDGMSAPDGTNGPLGSWTGWHVSMTGYPIQPLAPCAQMWIRVVTVSSWYTSMASRTIATDQPEYRIGPSDVVVHIHIDPPMYKVPSLYGYDYTLIVVRPDGSAYQIPYDTNSDISDVPYTVAAVSSSIGTYTIKLMGTAAGPNAPPSLLGSCTFAVRAFV